MKLREPVLQILADLDGGVFYMLISIVT